MATSDYRSRLYEKYSSALQLEGNPDAKVPFWRQLAQQLPDRQARVFELGAGRGDFLGHLQELGFARLDGVDGSPEQVADAQRRGRPVRLADATSALRHMANDSVDAVVAIDILEHLTKSEVFALLDECFRVLSPGGRMLIHTVNADSPFFGSVRYGDFTHETSFTSSSMRQVLRTIGFSRMDCIEDRPVVHGLKSGLRAAAWELVRSTAVVILAAETGRFNRHRILSQNFLTVAIK